MIKWFEKLIEKLYIRNLNSSVEYWSKQVEILEKKLDFARTAESFYKWKANKYESSKKKR